MKTSVRNTPAKRFVVTHITRAKKAISQRELQDSPNNAYDRVTLYRVLERLVNEGILHRATDKAGVIRYALCNHDHNGENCTHQHVHFHCEICDEVSCLENIIPEFQLPHGYKMHQVLFTITGSCVKCSTKSNSRKP